MIRPIILIGMNRSGTKWVSNLICSHEDVIGVQSERAGGILETNMFGAMQDKFNLSHPDDYVGFLELWAVTEFFKLAGIEKSIFYELDPRPRNLFEVFELLMNEVARRNNKRYWLQKTSPLHAPGVLAYFKNARIVVVRRNMRDTVRSNVGLQQRSRERSLFRATYRYVYQDKVLKRICANYPVVQMDYDRLRLDTSKEVARLFAELDLYPGKATSPVPFRKNATFESPEKREKIMSRRDEFLVRVLAGFIRLIPLGVIEAAVAARKLFVGRSPEPLVDGTFGALGDRLRDRTRGRG